MEKPKETLVSCEIEKAVATIVMDDGKANLISPRMLSQLNQALDKAEKASTVVVLAGREGIFSGGFDLKILKSGVFNAFNMLIGGFSLARRLLSFPTPVVVACNGHAMAMGSFILLSGDYRIGVEGEFKIAANEVEIGLTMPHSAVEICRQRLKPAYFDRAVLLSELFNPQTAAEAGFLDQVVPEEDLQTEARRWAEKFASLNLKAHRHSKLRMRRKILSKLRWAIWADRIDFVLQGLRRALVKQ